MNASAPADLREMKYAPSDIGRVALDGTFSGYASVYDKVDLGNDIVRPGAFAASLKRRDPSQIRMLFQHNADEPVGTWEAVEDTPRGLRVRGRIATSVTKGREVLELMRAGAIDGLSIGFRTIRSRQDPVTRARLILEADLWEISIVTFPMQEEARIESVKASAQATAATGPSIREIERWLVRDAGLTRKQARLFVAGGYREAFDRRDAGESETGLAAHIRAAAELIQSSTLSRNRT
jgi:HK97 family phage prohead protease